MKKLICARTGITEDTLQDMKAELGKVLDASGLLPIVEGYDVYLRYTSDRTVLIYIKLTSDYAYKEFTRSAYPSKFKLKLDDMLEDVELYVNNPRLRKNDYTIATIYIDNHLVGYVSEMRSGRGMARSFIVSDPSRCTKRFIRKSGVHRDLHIWADGDEYAGLDDVWFQEEKTPPKGDVANAYVVMLDPSSANFDVRYVDIRDAVPMSVADTRRVADYLRSIAIDWLSSE